MGTRGSHRFRWIAAGTALVVLAALGGWLTFRPTSRAATPSAAPGGIAPSVSGRTAAGGHFTLDSEKGHWVLVNFFASWCTDCRAELSQLGQLEQRHPAGLDVVSIDGLDDSFSAAAHLIKAGGGDWPLVNDPNALDDYHVESLPQSFLVNPSGRIVDHVFGGVTAGTVEAQLPGRPT